MKHNLKQHFAFIHIRVALFPKDLILSDDLKMQQTRI